ncbi:MAG: acyl-CoA thioesterase [Proteobacteria bacterium]|nr:acyl-CoA thioesterase [Pseudomonadota bacterium]MCP4916570.1 acyl-CoA thioesterase [Pseudomonadota bacterium]
MRFHETVFGVYFDDLDLFGILHNARYLLFMERAVGEFWRTLGWDGFEDRGQFHLVKSNHIEYVSPVTGVGQVRVRVTVTHLGTTSLKLGFRVMPLDEDADHAHGERVIVCVDPTTRRPVPWSEAFREKLAPFSPRS